MNTDPRDRMLELFHERITVAPYDLRWPAMYAEEEAFLQSALPPDLVIRIDHIGSTAVEGCSAKPIVDIQVEVSSLERVRTEVVSAMEGHGYEFIWRASIGEHSPFYAWFIRRDAEGVRTHHIHMVEPDTASEDRILFRDHLRSDPAEVLRYEKLKHALSEAYPNDRDSYTKGKSDFILSVVRHIREQRS